MRDISSSGVATIVNCQQVGKEGYRSKDKIDNVRI